MFHIEITLKNIHGLSLSLLPYEMVKTRKYSKRRIISKKTKISLDPFNVCKSIRNINNPKRGHTQKSTQDHFNLVDFRNCVKNVSIPKNFGVYSLKYESFPWPCWLPKWCKECKESKKSYSGKYRNFLWPSSFTERCKDCVYKNYLRS